MWRTTISLVNARVVTPDGLAGSIRFGSSILGVGEPPHRRDVVIDLNGAFVLPGLINAHDHLELNHYGRLRFRDRYENVSAWIDDIRPRLRQDPALRAGQSHRLAHRLFIGGLKNLLAGVTTVAHHNPLYRGIFRHCPVRVARDFGWAHSFQMEAHPVGAHGEPGGSVVGRHRATPTHMPFIVHLAEGVDDDAHAEYLRFRATGCLTANAAIVHGVAIAEDEWQHVQASGAGLIWCPSSNRFLFGRTPDLRRLLALPGMSARVALGTDSRVSGARDLLDELREAARSALLTSGELLGLVTSGPAALLRLTSAGHLTKGRPADLAVLPAHAAAPGAALLGASRRDVRLVMIGGRPLVGEPSMAPAFIARRVGTRTVWVDGVLKLMDASLAGRLATNPIGEPGVVCADDSSRTYAVATSR
jgi:cytosine/adenosine deaminase-related metal-dependent hydrolase